MVLRLGFVFHRNARGKSGRIAACVLRPHVSRYSLCLASHVGELYACEYVDISMCIVSYCYLDTRLVHGDTDIWSLYWAGYFVCAPSQCRFFSAATGRTHGSEFST